MQEVIWPECVYNFLKLIKSSPLEKKILDCGAGGMYPPLAFFRQKGYETYGIDISENAIDAANAFAERNRFKLNIQRGDMRQISFEAESFSFVYTQNSLCHLTKKDTAIVIEEIKRVLCKGGYCLVDFMSVESSFCNEKEMGKLVGDHEYQMSGREEDWFHSFFCDSEPDKYFSNMTIIRVDKIIIEHRAADPAYTDVRLYYYVQKPFFSS
ncbi:MAG: class I SAM-dependent methyltransferase [Promethearchaeota archaeon]